ncbi:MAG: hypothetical protein ACI9U2_002452 [Bradymonadia bacterium]|jgi:hypothetical protein
MTPLILMLHLALAGPPPLLVTRPDGLHVIDLQGKVRRTLLSGPVVWAHRLPGAQLAVDRGPKGLFVLPLDGKPRALAKLPVVSGCGFTVKTTAGEPQLRVQSVHDVTHSVDGRWLCLSVMDRNANMADVQADFDVELATGKVAARLAMAPNCPNLKITPSRCRQEARPKPASKPASNPATKAWPFSWNAKRAVFAGEPGAALDLCAGAPADQCDTSMSVAVSPSGRWRLVRLATGAGDYMHHALFALDHQTGGVYPIVEGAWAPALTLKQRQKLQSDYSAVSSLDVVGEAYIAATGHAERFVVDDLLIIPGARVVRVGNFVP